MHNFLNAKCKNAKKRLQKFYKIFLIASQYIDLLHPSFSWFRQMDITPLFVVIALLGSFYNATLRMKLSYMLWLVSNVYLCVHNFIIKEYSQSVLFGAYLITTAIGIKNTYKDRYWFKPNK